MNFIVLTLFPEMIEQGIGTSITGRALAQGTIRLKTINIRDYSHDRYGHVDDYPYGGGAGMVMMAPPIYEAWESAVSGLPKKPRLIYVTPQGKPFLLQHLIRHLKQVREGQVLCKTFQLVMTHALLLYSLKFLMVTSLLYHDLMCFSIACAAV